MLMRDIFCKCLSFHALFVGAKGTICFVFYQAIGTFFISTYRHAGSWQNSPPRYTKLRQRLFVNKTNHRRTNTYIYVAHVTLVTTFASRNKEQYYGHYQEHRQERDSKTESCCCKITFRQTYQGRVQGHIF